MPADLEAAAAPRLRDLLPYNTALFLGYCAVGVPLPVIALQAGGPLGQGPVAVGLVVGVQYLVTLLARRFAGRLCDRRGAKLASLAGFAGAALAGAIYLASALAPAIPLSLALLVLGRIAVGIGESLFVTGAAAWGIAHVGIRHTGKVLAWNGIAMYGALAIGAPLGILLFRLGGFALVSAAVIALPLAGAAVAAPLRRAIPRPATAHASFARILRAIWIPGLGLALASAGVGTIAAFLSLRYETQGWPGAGFAVSAFGATYIMMRLLFAGLPDRLGGRRVAIASLCVQATGLTLIWLANGPALAFIGAALTGTGYSLVFPSLGVEAMRPIAPENRGLALGAFLACFDLGLGIAGPAAGVVTAGFGLPAAFLAAACGALVSVVLLGMTGRRK
jgi:MFS family permease